MGDNAPTINDITTGYDDFNRPLTDEENQGLECWKSFSTRLTFYLLNNLALFFFAIFDIFPIFTRFGILLNGISGGILEGAVSDLYCAQNVNNPAYTA